MLSRQAAPYGVLTQPMAGVAGIRPVTLLIATGIALIAAVLMVTGIAANHLRQQALMTAGGELARIDGLLAATTDRTLNGIDVRLAAIADGLGAAAAGDPAGFRTAASSPRGLASLRRELGRFPRIDGLALVAGNGQVLNHAGAWPGDARLLDARILSRPGVSSLGPAIRDPRTGVIEIARTRRFRDAAGGPVGAVIAMVPEAVFTSPFGAVSLPSDAAITLLRPDGATLARYPGKGEAAAGRAGRTVALGRVSGSARLAASGGEWEIQAVRALADHSAAVMISRGAAEVLAQWSHQILWLGAFAIAAAVAIGVMVFLIARQFQAHAALAALRAERIEAEKIEIERARLAAETELLKSERLSVLGQLTATVAHELRNPLSAIRNTLFTVKELTTNAGVKLERPVARIERSIERCDRIISDLLEYARNRELSRSNLRFDGWLADLLAEQRLPEPVSLAAEFGAGDAIVAADADRIRRVVINLVENAVQALAETPPERDKRITVCTAVADGELMLAVEDNGPGIAPDNRARIFEPLFSTKSFGTGLGLPTVKQIVNQHGGTIAVDSAVGQGTRITVRLPIAVDAAEDAKVAA